MQRCPLRSWHGMGTLFWLTITTTQQHIPCVWRRAASVPLADHAALSRQPHGSGSAWQTADHFICTCINLQEINLTVAVTS